MAWGGEAWVADRRVFCSTCETERELFGLFSREQVEVRESWPGGPRTLERSGFKVEGQIWWCSGCRTGLDIETARVRR